MKKVFFSMVAASVLVLSACNNKPAEEAAATTEATEAVADAAAAATETIDSTAAAATAVIDSVAKP